MGGPVLGPHFESVCARSGPSLKPGTLHFCGAARILKMIILPPMAVGGVLLAAPGAGRRHWSPRPGPGEELIPLEELHPGRGSHASAFPPGLFLFPPRRRRRRHRRQQ